MSAVTDLHAAVLAVVPDAVGVSIGRRDDRSTWRVQLAEGASAQDLAAAQAAAQPIIDAFDVAAAERDPSLRRVHPYYFRLRFTQAQRVAIATSTDPLVVDLREGFAAADTIGLDDPRTAAGLQLLVARGLIAAGDVAALLADRRPDEKP